MLLPKFEYYDPESVEAACGLLSELRGQAKLLAGGTDLIVNMKRKSVVPDHVVSLSKMASLRSLDASNGTVRIGAYVTAGEIAASDAIQRDFAALAAGAAVLGSPLIRNLATIGGNLVTARPAADTPTPLLIYNARLTLKSSGGGRQQAHRRFPRISRIQARHGGDPDPKGPRNGL
jgi:carbon-monoxide dehydrogenase medium subunit